MDDADRQVELEQSQAVPEYERQRKKDELMKKLSRHNPKRRKLGIEIVRGTDGEPILDKDAAGDHLCKHWGDKFKQHPIDSKSAKSFTRVFSKRFPVIQWMLTFAAFVEIVNSCKASAPGPDGVPYAAWSSDVRVQVVLYSAYIR